jgi:glycosyltransferase involved in cell wall biosynthesis
MSNLPLRILHFIPAYAPAWSLGGPVRSVSALCAALVRAGHQVAVITTNEHLSQTDFPGDGQRVMRDGVAVHYFPRDRWRRAFRSGFAATAREMAAESDIVHVTSIWHSSAFVMHRAAALQGKPVVVSPRGALGPYAWNRRRTLKAAFHLWERRYLRRAAGFHFTSEQERRESLSSCASSPACVIANGIDNSVWYRDQHDGSTIREQLGVRTDARLLLYAGRMHHKKGLDILPETLVCLMQSPTIPECHVLFVGPDEDGTGVGLRRSFAARGLARRVHFMPTLSETALRNAYSAADVFVLPSHHENFGNAAIEALACGCPVVVSEQAACIEVGRGLGMIGVADRTPSAWATALRAALSQERSVFVRVQELVHRVGIQVTAERMVKFYRECEGRKRELHA